MRAAVRIVGGPRRLVTRRWCSSASVDNLKPWQARMPDDEFELMRTVCGAPTPVGLEEAMNRVIMGDLEGCIPSGWKWHRFQGNAGAVLDTNPDNTSQSETPTIMVMGHSDKIRCQVRKIASDGKVYIDTDSHLPLTLLGNPVIIYSEDASNPGAYRAIKGGTVEALGAIHFAEASLRSGSKGIKPESLYVELQIHGENKAEQVSKHLGIRVGDSILMDRPLARGVGLNSFQGAYLDNGLGCFITAQAAKLASRDPATIENVRVLYAFATHEEIGRFGSRVLARHFSPDILIAVDVNHDYNAAPGVSARNFPDISMGAGPTLAIGSISSPFLNSTIQKVAQRAEIPLQLDVNGRDTGTDAMASFLSCIDCATTSIGVPIRNMHTFSETGTTTDVVATYHLVAETIRALSASPNKKEWIQHPNLSDANVITSLEFIPDLESSSE